MEYSQWLRYFRLVVSVNGSNTDALDLSDFRVKFKITQAVVGKPTTAEITVYNVSPSTINKIQVPSNRAVASSRLKVIIEAGYQANHSVIFQGDLWWKSTGRESETDTFMKLIAATGDKAHQFAVVNTSIPKGATQAQVFNAVAKSFEDKGVRAKGMPKEVATATKLPRGKVIYMMSRDAMQNLADTNNFNWGYGSDGLIAIPKEPIYDKSKDVIVLNARTGLIGRPTITVNGINAQCLLNPRLDIGSLLQIDNSTIQGSVYDTSVDADIMQQQTATDAFISADGLYRVISREFVGDTRGNDWFANLICEGVNASQKPISPTVMNTIPNF